MRKTEHSPSLCEMSSFLFAFHHQALACYKTSEIGYIVLCVCFQIRRISSSTYFQKQQIFLKLPFSSLK